jgi:DNA repair protein RadC
MAENKRHKGHRQRMRERVQNYGLDSLAEHEALEYVLYLTNAQKDTNGIAHDLIDRFGDFAAVLEASEEELCTVEGVGPSTARMLHLLPQISRYYGRSRTSTTRTEQMGSYLMAKFAWSDYERAMLVSLDSRKRVRAAVWLREGTSDRVSLDIKNVVAAAIKGGTDAVVLCHNHPNGVALPSLEDMDATGSIARALGLVNVHLLDHFILTDTEYFSMRDANRLPIYDFKTGTLFWP